MNLDAAAESQQDFTSQAAQWRQAFDQSFAQAAQAKDVTLQDYLAIQAGGTAYALRLVEISGLQVLRGITPCPSQRRDLLGLASFRSAVVPVYDLRVLLGHPGGDAPAWWVLSKDGALGLAFDVFERHLRLPPAVSTSGKAAETGRYASEALQCEGQLRRLVSIDSILADIRASLRLDLA